MIISNLFRKKRTSMVQPSLDSENATKIPM